MMDSLYRREQEAFWDRLGRRLVRAGISADAVTLGAFCLSVLNCLAFLSHRNPWAFGLALAFTELLDNLDGAVARVSGTKTRRGAFLDAATDRYKETISLFVVAWVTGYWMAGFAAVSGSLLVSYNHARAAMEGAVVRGSAFDLFERFERVATLVLGLMLSPFLKADAFFGRDALFGSLVIIAALSHVTALQRLVRALGFLGRLDRDSSQGSDRG